MKFYDRNLELSILAKNRELSKNHSVMTTVIGRRRVGKTSLLIKSVEGDSSLYLYVSKDSESLLCSKFQAQAQHNLGANFMGRATTFGELFENLMLWGKEHNYTLIIDEFQNLLTVNKNIPGIIQGGFYKFVFLAENGVEPIKPRPDRV